MMTGAEIFLLYPDAKEVYCTSDGGVHLSLQQARQQSAHLKDDTITPLKSDAHYLRNARDIDDNRRVVPADNSGGTTHEAQHPRVGKAGRA